MTRTRPTDPSVPAARLRALLTAWYRRAARDLPWRRTRDPYAVWISEAMLQQTRVEAVLEPWRRFLARFPRVEDLAAAGEDDVLAQWSGLGYYRRARSLHRAAQAIVERHGGRFPRTSRDARALPGVGPYTAGAVLSIAYDLPEPLVDGNVERVFARLFALEAAAGSPALQRAAWGIAEELVPERGAGEWNQALMELGATVCTPRAPRCDACPWAQECLARAGGRAEELPLPKARRAPVDVRLEVLVDERAGALLLEQRPEGGRMARLWQPPTREVPVGDAPPTGLFPAAWPAGARVALGAPLFELRHAITHHRITAAVHAARVVGAPAGWARLDASHRATLGLTGMAKKVLARLA